MRVRELILRIITVFMLLYSMSVFGRGIIHLRRAEADVEESRAELADLLRENENLKEKLAGPEPNDLERLARQKLGMVMPDEKIYIFDKDREEP